MGIDAEMYVLTTAEVTEQQVLEWAVRLAAGFGYRRVLAQKEFRHHALEIVEEYEQDGPMVRPGPGETMIRVHLCMRYYGPGYERGDLPFLVAVAKWLEINIPESRVYYGGDSSGVCATLFDEAAREELFKHFASPAGYEYHFHWGSFRKTVTRCSFCNDAKMPWYRGGNKQEGFICLSCGLHRVLDLDGKVIGEAYGRWHDEARR